MATRATSGLRPTLGLFTAITVVAGTIIGSGIFRLPATMMFLVQNPLLLLLVWILGGLFTIAGALTLAELAGMFPSAGGPYVYLRESLGRSWAFLYGWSTFWVVWTGVLAAVALVFAEFTQVIFGFADAYVAPLAVSAIVALSVVNYFGARLGGLVQRFATIAKIGGILLLVVLGFLLGNPAHGVFEAATASPPTGWSAFTAFLSALLLGLFAYEGWAIATYMASEVKEPRRNVPRAMIVGVLVVVTVYVLATLTYIFLVAGPEFIAIGNPETAGGRRIASEAARAFAGGLGANLISVAVVVSAFGTMNGLILACPRIYYAVARDGLFWSPFGELHPTTNVPHKAILFQALWAGILVALARLSADAYTAIVGAVVYALWLFHIPTVVGYFRLRRMQPNIPRPYRTHGYPWVPLAFLLSATLVVVNFLYANLVDLFTKPLSTSVVAGLSAVWGTVLILTGVPVLVYWRWLARNGRPNPVTDSAQRPKPGIA
jgi:basic amino acid/polyamine antiporter, APA family